MPDRPPTPPSARPTSKDARREAARERARQLRELEARRKRRNRVLAISAGIVAVVLVVGGVAFAVTRAGGSADVATPPGVSADGGIVVGQDTAAHTVTIFQDYQCPACKQYEGVVGPWLDEQVEAGVTKLEYRPLNFLDRRLNQDYSTRAANLAFCIAGDDGIDFTAFNTAMYLEQPEEGAGGLTDNRLISIAESAGATDPGSCVASGTYDGFVQKVNDAAFDLTDADGNAVVTGTPTVLVDGRAVTDDSGAPTTSPTQEQLATALGVTDDAAATPSSDASASAFPTTEASPSASEG